MHGLPILNVGICNVAYDQVIEEALSADVDTASEWAKSVWEECKKEDTKEEIYYADERTFLQRDPR
jgi:hypothetical protein